MGDDDYSVEVTGTFEVRYREGDRQTAIEMDFRDPTPVLYASAIQPWRYPHDRTPLTAADRRRIIERVAHHLRDERGFTIEIDQSS